MKPPSKRIPIRSASNKTVKALRRLSRARKREAHILIEGRKLVATALEAGVAIETIVVSAGRGETELASLDQDVTVVVLEDALFRSVSTLDSPEGVLAIAERPSTAPLPAARRLVVAAGVQEPGNLGALARVAEAAGADGLAVTKGSADPFGPRAIRGSAGSVLRLPVHEIDDLSGLPTLRRVALVPRGGTDYRELDWRPASAIVVGSEGGGLEAAIEAACDVRVSVPMSGRVESLNVATAAAVVLYEAKKV